VSAGFRLSGRHGSGLPFGCTPTQAVIAAVGFVTAAGVAVTVGGPVALGVIGVVVVTVGVAGWWPDRSGRPAHEAAGRHAGFVTRRRRWQRTVPWGWPAGRLPAPFHTVTVDGSRGGPNDVPVALIGLRRAARVSVVVPVDCVDTGSGERDASDRVLRWGAVLAAFGRDRGLIQVTVAHRRRPFDPAAHVGVLPDDQAARARYLALVTDPTAVVHEQHLVVTARDRPAVARLVDALTVSAPSAGLRVGAPWTVAQWCDQVAHRLDPTRPWRAPVTLAEHLGVVPIDPTVPSEVTVTRTAVRTGGVWHRVFWVAAWPTGPVPAGWFDPLHRDGPGLHTWTTVMVPVPARRSRRQLTADAVALRADVEHRHRHGFRVPGPLAAAETVLDTREAELHAGALDYRWVTLLELCATTIERLDEHTDAWHDLAARAGIVLGAVDGAHDLALGHCLPFGSTPGQRRGR